VTPESARRGNGWWFVAWLVVGGLYALALLSALTIGVFILPVAALATVRALSVRGSSAGLPGLVSGLGLPRLWVADLNRSGPGRVCSTTASGSVRCDQEGSPWPRVAVGMVLLTWCHTA